ncbi:MAG TPA: AAA family ATPase [Candidatus Binataceae bacterium]|nr:AAA family ATPase [Candidatus Binataceae bacterium]
MDQSALPERGVAAANFIGRARELTELGAGLDDAIEGRGRLFLLAGEPGIGKTRLADRFARLATARGFQVVWGRCWEGEGAPAYWPIIQVIRACIEGRDAGQLEVLLGPGTREISRLIPELRPARPSPDDSRIMSDQESARFRLFSSVATFLKNVARAEPLLIIVDDLHDADQPSLHLLRFIAREIKRTRIAMIVTYRDAEIRQSPELARLAGALIREGLTIPLAGLSQDEVGRFIERTAGQKARDTLITELYRVSGGSPLFVEGVVRLLVAEGKIDSSTASFEIPDGVRESIRRRLAALSTETNSTLSIASVIGNDFKARLLEALPGLSAEQIVERMDEAARFGIVTGGSAPHWQYRFSHALVREVLYKDLPAKRRIELHGEIGAAIENIYHDDLNPYHAALAHHFSAAGFTEKAIEHSLGAGAAASAVFAYQEARAHWERALNLMQGEFGSPPRRASLLHQLAGLCFMIDYSAAIRYAEATLALYRTLGDEARVAEWHARLGIYYAVPYADTSDVCRAREHFRKARESLAGGPEGLTLARVYTGIMQTAFVSRRTEEGLAAGKLAMEIAQRFNDDAQWANSALQYSLHLVESGRLAESHALQEQAWQKIDHLNIGRLAFLAAWIEGSCHLFLLDIPEAARCFEHELSKPRIEPFRAVLAGLYANLLARSGGVVGAQSLATEAVPAQHRADILFLEGRWDEATTLLSEKRPKLRSSGDLNSLARCLNVAAEIHHVSGRENEALATFGELLATADGELQLAHEMAVRPVCAEIHARLNHLEAAARELARCRQIMAAGEDWRGLEGTVIRAEAVLAAAQGGLNEAGARFEKAIEIFRRFRVPFEEVEALLLWGQALVSAGECAQAGAKFDSAIAIYQRCGAGDRWIERIEASRVVLKAPPSLNASFSQVSPAADEAEFRREGDYWTIAFGGKTLRFRDTKGFHYIAYLLARPGEDLRALDLVLLVGGDSPDKIESGKTQDLARSQSVTSDLGDAGEVLDAQAKSAYRARLAQLEEELEDARELGNEARVESTQQEIVALGRELKRAVGLSGRDRRAASGHERARIAVTQAIRFALGKIAKNDADLSKMLTSAIKTGTFCSYRPSATPAVRWRL